MSNHFHMCVTDPEGRISDFLKEFDSRLSRQLNAMRGTTGTNFGREPGIQAIADDAGVIEQAVYTLTNPLAAHLVEHLRQWKASSSFHLEYGDEITFARPKFGLWAETLGPARKGKHASRGRLRYRGRSTAPATATFTLARPNVRTDQTPKQLRELVRGRVATIETTLIEERRRAGRKVVGWLGVVTRHYLSTSKTPRVLFERSPRVTGQDSSACAKVLTKLDRFVTAYRRALAAFCGGGWPTFPYGTLQMAQRYDVVCAKAPP